MQTARHLGSALMVLMLTACGGGGSYVPPPPPPGMYFVGGYVAGLTGSGLTLSYNDGPAAPISRNGSFMSATGVSPGTAYNVTIVNQPTNPTQSCIVSNGSGMVGSGSVTSVLVYCPQETGKWVYVATVGSIPTPGGGSATPGTLSAYAIDATSGALTAVAGSKVATGPASVSLQLVPHSSYLWELSAGENMALDQDYLSSIYAYSLDANTGLLSPNPGNPFYTLSGTSSTPAVSCLSAGQGITGAVTFTPSGTFGYAANSDQPGFFNRDTWAFAVTSGTPGALAVEVPNACGTVVTVDPSGQFAYYAQAVNVPTGVEYQLIASTVSTTNGALTAVSGTSPLPIANGRGAAAIDPYGRFVYVFDSYLIYVFQIDPASGALAAITGSPFSFSPSGLLLMVISPNAKFAYILTSGGTNSGLYTYEIAATGALSAVGAAVPLQVTSGLGGQGSILQLDPSGRFLYVSASPGSGQQGVYAFALDAGTGTPTLVTGSPFAVTAQYPELQLAVGD